MSPSSTSEAEEIKPKKPDIQALMATIRAKIKAEIGSHIQGNKKTPFKPYTADENLQASRKAGELLHSEELRYLNMHYAHSSNLNLNSISTHRPGFLGKLIVKTKQKVLGLIWNSLLRNYFSQERDFHANLVRLLNDISKYVDARDASNFWELIRKVDYDVTKSLDRIERIHDEGMASLRSMETTLRDEFYSNMREMSTKLDKLHQHEERLKTLESVSQGFERILAQVSSRGLDVEKNHIPTQTKPIPDFSYLLLENRFRGSEDEISNRVSIYVPVFKNAKKPVLEIGCGRGELQELFRTQNIPSLGVDLDCAMVERAKEKKLRVKEGDGIEYLKSCEPASLGGLIAIQVVEHLPIEILKELISLASKKVEKGGKVVFETIDPQSIIALSSNYFRDPTHVQPLHPDTLSFMMNTAGLKVLEVRPLSPFPLEAQLKEIPVPEYATPHWAETLACLNGNIQRLNSLLYGFQDYCVVAEVP